MLKAKHLLLDEVCLGTSANYVNILLERVAKTTKEWVAILVVERNPLKALEICQPGYIF
jgi:ABC-type branched-subunit amino acid transport system ATPase component